MNSLRPLSVEHFETRNAARIARNDQQHPIQGKRIIEQSRPTLRGTQSALVSSVSFIFSSLLRRPCLPFYFSLPESPSKV